METMKKIIAWLNAIAKDKYQHFAVGAAIAFIVLIVAMPLGSWWRWVPLLTSVIAVMTAITDVSNGTHRHQLPKGMATISTINAIAAPTAKCWYLSLAMALSHAMIFFIVSI